MGRGTGTCGCSCPIQQWDLSRERPVLSRRGRKATLEGERVGDTKQELLWVPCQGEQSLWVSSWITHVLLLGSWLCFSPLQDDPPRPHITACPAILLEMEGEKSRIRDGVLHLLLLLWIHSPCTGDFCWVPSSSEFSIHFSACNSCTLFFVIVCPPPSALSLSAASLPSVPSSVWKGCMVCSGLAKARDSLPWSWRSTSLQGTSA